MSLENSFGNDDGRINIRNKILIEVVLILLSLSGSDHRQLKFVVPFQGGFDGTNPAKENKKGTNITAYNTQGFDYQVQVQVVQ